MQLTGVKCNQVMSLTEVAATFWSRKQPTVVKYNKLQTNKKQIKYIIYSNTTAELSIKN